MAFKKESWINNKRHYKRHIRNQWMHGHAARAVDGDYDQTLHRYVIHSEDKMNDTAWCLQIILFVH